MLVNGSLIPALTHPTPLLAHSHIAQRKLSSLVKAVGTWSNRRLLKGSDLKKINKRTQIRTSCAFARIKSLDDAPRNDWCALVKSIHTFSVLCSAPSTLQC